jgi:hypothetical protein
MAALAAQRGSLVGFLGASSPGLEPCAGSPASRASTVDARLLAATPFADIVD